jgi:uncharacterized protein
MVATSDQFSSSPADPNATQLLDPYPSSDAAIGRHVQLEVSWQQKGIAKDLAPHLKSLTYADNLSGAADDLALELEDRANLWAGDWQPNFGDQVVARLKYDGAWFGQKVTDLRLGTYAHDKIRLSGPPHLVSLQCVSAPLATGLRRRKRTHVWQGVNLQQIANDIAQRAQLQLNFSGSAGPAYKKAVQNDKSDLEFLEHQCKEVGRTLKVTESQIVIYDEMKLDAGDAVGDIDLGSGNVIGWDFDADDSQRYGSCHIKCFDPRTGKVSQGQFPPSGTTIQGLDPNGQTLELSIGVSDVGEATTRAQALLRNANRFATSGKMTTLGDPGLVAGVIFNLKGAANLNGKFIVTKATHTPVGGYTTALEVRRCLEGY